VVWLSLFYRQLAQSSAPDSKTCTACVSTFRAVSGTVHAVILSPVLDVDEACYYTSTCRTVGRRQSCYRWSSAYRRQLRRLFLARSHDVQPSESAGHVFLFVNNVQSSHLQLSTVHAGVHGTVSCRTALT